MANADFAPNLTQNIASNLGMTADEDLPRTLRREKEARQREALGRSLDAPEYRAQTPPKHDYPHTSEAVSEPTTVTRLSIPFFHLMLFFFKAVFAAIPALILLGALLWLVGDLLMAYYPQLVKLQIIIKVPN